MYLQGWDEDWHPDISQSLALGISVDFQGNAGLDQQIAVLAIVAQLSQPLG
ncbi:hypothetical protein ACN4EK_30075 [Pantanalinema rosaneae CENA516]|uniref:hypothetical protein n=1 Tax=Pantanalinema rosaneae TaxID=1620701 RepID=UPI003D6FB7F4